MSSSGIAVGLKKGYPVEKKEKVPRPSQAKAVRITMKELSTKNVLNKMSS